jgi:undecaprenyl-diphosphatase
MSGFASWLNRVFQGPDTTIASWFAALNHSAGSFFTPVFRFITVLGDLGLIFLLASLVMMLFRKSRKAGLTAFFAILIGALFTNIILKNIVVRPRPFIDETSSFYQWWFDAGQMAETGYSFPSGHATSSMAFATACFLLYPKKKSWAFFLLPLIMGITRIYFMVHYASDVFAGFLFGGIAGVISFSVFRALFHRPKVCAFLDVDVIPQLKKNAPSAK